MLFQQLSKTYKATCLSLWACCWLADSWAATPPNTVIENTVSAFYGSPATLAAQASVSFTVSSDIPADIDFLSLVINDQAVSETSEYYFSGAFCRSTSSSNDAFNPVALSLYDGSSVVVDTDLEFLTAINTFSEGDPVFVRVVDFDENLDDQLKETVVVTVTNSSNGDAEVIRLTETGANTGEFIGGIQLQVAQVNTGNCVIDIEKNDELRITYIDKDTVNDTVSTSAKVDPKGVIFNTDTGELVDGVQITLVDDASGLPADVFSPNGVDRWPSTVITGDDVVDSSGRVFRLQTGEFRFPYLASGSYRYTINNPTAYSFPSVKKTDELQALPNGPFSLASGSLGEAFTTGFGALQMFDVPIDPLPGVIYIEKQVARENAALGDFIAYTLTVTNEVDFTLRAIELKDVLPKGFRIQPNSLTINGVVNNDFSVGKGGRDVRIRYQNLAAGESLTVQYVTEITSGAEVGKLAINYASSALQYITSNTASAEVMVTNDLYSDVAFLVGRVYEGSCDITDDRVGVTGAKIYLEDGRSVMTDRDGRWHFAGLEPGLHVLRLDEGSLAEGYELLACDESSRNLDTPNSAFVELKEGVLWRKDFVLKRTDAAVNTPDIFDQLIVDRVFDDVSHMPTYDTSSIVDSEFKVLWPEPNYTPRFKSLKVAIQHKITERVQLFLNGQLVSPLNRRDSFRHSMFQSQISTWAGIDLNVGNNQLEIRRIDSRGRVLSQTVRTVHYSGAPYRARYLPEKSQLNADGRTPIIVAVALTDEEGFAVRAGTSGYFKVSAPFRAWLPENLRLENAVLPQASNQARYVVRENGIAYFALDATTQTGRVVITVPLKNKREENIEAWLTADTRDWILVGLAEGSVGYERVKGYVAGQKTVEKDYYTDGRVSLFGKGRIPGDYLLSIAYDSVAQSGTNPDTLLNDAKVNDYYSVYGDESLFEDEAESARKLYLKIERQQFYALFGDFQTGLSVTELSQYNRTLNGVKSEYKDKYFETNVFAAETALSNLRDELEGKGISGPYYLSRRQIVRNSEQIVLEVRDRFQTGQVLSSAPLSRGNDYDINYTLGVLRFRKPVNVRDPLLNPVVIVVNYESQDDREAALVAGGRAEVSTADDRVEVGVSYITEENTGKEAQLGGVDVKIDITEDMELRSEFATSDTVTRQGADAWSMKLQQNSQAFSSSIYATEIDSGFGLGQQNESEESRRKLGANTVWRFTQGYELAGAVDTQENLLDGAINSQANLNARRIGDKTAFQLGYRYAESKEATGIKQTSELMDVSGSYQMMPSLRLDASSEFAVNNKDNAALYPARYTVGAEWQVTQSAALFALQEMTSGSEKSSSTQVGVRSSLWDGADINVGVNQRRANNLSQLSTVTGFMQRLQLNDNISMDFIFDQGKDLSPSTDVMNTINGNFRAASLGLDWRFIDWSWNNQIETRHSDKSTERGIRTGILHQLDAGRSMIGTYQWFNKKAENQQTIDQTISVSFADRRSINYVWLNRLDFNWNKIRGDTALEREQKVVSNNALNVTAWKDGQLSLAYSAKYIVTNVNAQAFSGFTDFVGAHYRHNVTRHWDVGVQSSLLHSRNANNKRYSYGVSTGVSPVQDIWLELGYNFEGFSDNDFSAARNSIEGAYFSIRLKFDEKTVGRVRRAFSPKATQPPPVLAVKPESEDSIVELLSTKPSSSACKNGNDTEQYVQIIAYADQTEAEATLATIGLDNASIETYQPKDSNISWYRIVIGPFADSKAVLEKQTDQYESILGGAVWVRSVQCMLMRGNE